MLCCIAKTAVAAALLLSATACQIEDVYITRDGGTGQSAARPDAGTSSTRPEISDPGDVFAFLQSSTWRMPSADIPSHPNGYDENVNFGQATQCLHEVRIESNDRSLAIVTVPGTLRDAPRSGDQGACDRAAVGGSELIFDTTAVLIENVRDGGRCFDITLTYSGFGQEGRGSIGPDGDTLELELFFRDQAVGHRCASGEVGSPSVTLNQERFNGTAVQLYQRGN